MNDNISASCEKQSNQLFSDGHWRAALIILEKGLNQEPNETALLSMYVEISKKIFSESPCEDQIEPLSRLEEFVLSRLAYASLDHTNEIIHIANEIANARDALVADLVNVEKDFDENNVLWQRALADNLNADDILGEDSDELALIICNMESILENLPSRLTGEIAVERISEAIAIAKLAQAFDIARNSIETRIAHCQHTSDDSLTVYSLQQAESLFRNFAAEPERLGVYRRKLANQLLDQLKTASEKIASQARETEAHAKWKEFMSVNSDTFNSINFLSDKRAIFFIDNAQVKLKTMQALIYKLQGIVPSLAGTKAGEEAFEKMNKVGELLGNAAAIQQRRYDIWALNQVRSGYKKGSEHAGIIDNEKKIAKALIDDFGPIDTRLLSSEVQRSYSEVFELLFERLDKPSKDENKDYENAGGKLYTLKAMMDISKKSLADF